MEMSTRDKKATAPLTVMKITWFKFGKMQRFIYLTVRSLSLIFFFKKTCLNLYYSSILTGEKN